MFEIIGETEDTIDCFRLGDALRGMYLNPSISVIEKYGGTQKRGKYRTDII